MFDIKEIIVIPAYSGLPNTSINRTSFMFGIISRYFIRVNEAGSEVH